MVLWSKQINKPLITLFFSQLQFFDQLPDINTNLKNSLKSYFL